MKTRRNINSRTKKTKGSGKFWPKSWTDNYRNCVKKYKLPSGDYDGKSLRDKCNNGNHKSMNYHSDGSVEAWHGNQPIL